ncbi:MAG: hypothetical protein EDR02_18700 [Actinobacteria bacterium]|nr:MAG: hypothetical protein EDR02_18700 [Actinomycetota bacterium]RIK02115.1 MAG: hypothetical protein DCC48_18475 [Acidobacteriota bacterium]
MATKRLRLLALITAVALIAGACFESAEQREAREQAQEQGLPEPTTTYGPLWDFHDSPETELAIERTAEGIVIYFNDCTEGNITYVSFGSGDFASAWAIEADGSGSLDRSFLVGEEPAGFTTLEDSYELSGPLEHFVALAGSEDVSYTAGYAVGGGEELQSGVFGFFELEKPLEVGQAVYRGELVAPQDLDAVLADCEPVEEAGE